MAKNMILIIISHCDLRNALIVLLCNLGCFSFNKMKSFEVLPEEHAHLAEKAFWYNALNREACVLKNDVKPPDFISASQRRFGSASGSQPRRWEKTDSFANVIYFAAFFLFWRNPCRRFYFGKSSFMLWDLSDLSEPATSLEHQISSQPSHSVPAICPSVLPIPPLPAHKTSEHPISESERENERGRGWARDGWI